jgi:hypothetical protein
VALQGNSGSAGAAGAATGELAARCNHGGNLSGQSGQRPDSPN